MTPAIPVTPSEPDRYVLESAKLVADLAAKTYADENDRTKSLDTKAGVLLSATSAALAIIAGTATKPPDAVAKLPTTAPDYWVVLGLYFGAVALAVLLLVVAQVGFIRSIRAREFRQPVLEYWVDEDQLVRPAANLYGELASTYEDATSVNATENTRKANFQQWAVLYLGAGVVLLAGVLIPLITYVSIAYPPVVP